MYNKDDVLTVKIEDMGSEGQGIGKVNGYALFVKDTIIGDEVQVKIMKAKKNYAYARLLKILMPSPYRVEPRCPVYRQCGGCQIQALDYKEQLRFKENKIKNNLQRIGEFSETLISGIMESIIGMEEPYHYRNKAQFPVGTNKDSEIIAGFYAGRTHTIIPNIRCCLGAEENEQVLEAVLFYMKEYAVSAYDEESHKGLVRNILIRKGFITGEIMVCVVVNGEKLPEVNKLVEKLTRVSKMTSITLNVNRERTNVIMGKTVKTLWGQDYITDYIKDVAFRISPLSFYQVNPVQTEKLYVRALEYAGLTGTETVWDLYCGIGTISLFLSQKAKQVYGVEIVPEAIEDARVNAAINGIQNVEFFVGNAELVLSEMYEKNVVKADVIVVDPPRKGCDEVLLETIVKMKADRVVYVSCDSATLARDLRYLCDGGYEVRKVCGVDMFGHTVHVETIVELCRK